MNGPFLGDIQCLKQTIQSQIAGSELDSFPEGVGLCHGCPLAPVLVIVCMDKISSHSQGEGGVQFGDLRIPSLLFADDVVL